MIKIKKIWNKIIEFFKFNLDLNSLEFDWNSIIEELYSRND